MWNKFCSVNTPMMKLLRTIFQGIIGVIVAYLDAIIGHIGLIPDEMRPIIVALIMAILSPIMAALGDKSQQQEE